MMKKFQILQEYLKKLGSVAVAFSGGVDSAFLLKTAQDVLGEHTAALTVSSSVFPDREQTEAQEFCAHYGIRQTVVELDTLKIEGFADNPPDRCYLCKRAVFGELLQTAQRMGFSYLAEGSNIDDMGDYRPGMRAVDELGIQSPLRYAGLTKREIRALSKEMGLPTGDKPSYACLASRFVYGETITREKLAMVEQAEQLLYDCGFRQARVRVHGNLARVEVLSEDLARIMEKDMRLRIYSALQELGFAYVTLDMQGYRTGSMNESLR